MSLPILISFTNSFSILKPSNSKQSSLSSMNTFQIIFYNPPLFMFLPLEFCQLEEFTRPKTLNLLLIKLFIGLIPKSLLGKVYAKFLNPESILTLCFPSKVLKFIVWEDKLIIQPKDCIFLNLNYQDKAIKTNHLLCNC
jgi:hypothetical protein